MEICIILGALRQQRLSHLAAGLVLKELEARGENVTIIDLQEVKLPLYGLHTGTEPAIQQCSAKLHSAKAVVFLSPEYQGSYTAALKNFTEYFFSEFKRKAVGIVATSTGRMGGINASIMMQLLAASLGAVASPVKLLVPNISPELGTDRCADNDKLLANVASFADEFLWLANSLQPK